MHPCHLAKLPGHTQSHSDIGRHHITAVDLTLPVLEHPIPILAHSAPQAQSLLLVQSSRRDRGFDRHCRLYDEYGWRVGRYLESRIPSTRYAEIVVDHV